MTSKPYNGHKNWNHWNVSLWIGNDEALYRLALRCIHSGNRRQAAETFLELVGATHTPDGAPYSLSSVTAAMRGL